MDKEIEKYRFGITLELQPGCYGFGTQTTPPVYVYSICKHAPAYFELEGVTLRPSGKNLFICAGIREVNIIRTILAAYWDSVNNQCVSIL